MLRTTLLLLLISVTLITNAQFTSSNLPEKVKHAEPLFMDLVRDLGARKGEKEINVGADFSNTKDVTEYAFLVEYEFAPVHRLGLEVEADFSFYKSTKEGIPTPENRLEVLRFSSQYSFYVSTPHSATMALGYTQLIGLTAFNSYGQKNILETVAYNPFFVVAKRWRNHLHSLLYAGPVIEHNILNHKTNKSWQLNTSFHYVIPHTGHFIGLEINKEIDRGNFHITLRPQAKVKLNKALALGIVTGFPIHNKEEKFSSFFRVIWEL